MIYLREQPPLIHLGAGGSVALEHDWLKHYLEEAAMAAGYPEWPAADVARSVTAFLTASRSSQPYSFEGFTHAVQNVLSGIGYSEVAPHFLSRGLEVRYSLLEITNTTPAGFELGLFQSCADLCHRLLSSKAVSRLCFQDLRPAVKKSLSRSHWCPRCEKLSDEIVQFLRAHLQKIAADRPLTFSIV